MVDTDVTDPYQPLSTTTPYKFVLAEMSISMTLVISLHLSSMVKHTFNLSGLNKILQHSTCWIYIMCPLKNVLVL